MAISESDTFKIVCHRRHKRKYIAYTNLEIRK